MAKGNKEYSTADMEIGQSSAILLPDEGGIERGAPILPIDSPEGGDYVAQLAFAEEPITIRIERSSDKNAPKFIDCWVNGKGIEAFINGKWLELNAVPVGVPVTTKRKYVEVLARAKHTSYSTIIEDEHTDRPRNMLDPSTSHKAPFSVLKDENPRGHEWLTRLMAEEG